jgi:hypothetical protein
LVSGRIKHYNRRSLVRPERGKHAINVAFRICSRRYDGKPGQPSGRILIRLPNPRDFGMIQRNCNCASGVKVNECDRCLYRIDNG